jgi:hypothetical protein
MDPHARLTLESLVRELAFYDNELREVEEQLRQMGRQRGGDHLYGRAL